MKKERIMKLVISALIAVSAALNLSGCDYYETENFSDNTASIHSEKTDADFSENTDKSETSEAAEEIETTAEEAAETSEMLSEISEFLTEPNTYVETESGSSAADVKFEISAPPFTYKDIPEYDGRPYAEINGNVPFFSEFPEESFEYYSPLDELGRCGVTYANISAELMPTEKRGEIGAVKPSGWHTVKYNGIIDDLYLYNRCHLIGYQLTGENANVCNLITGTRYMNTEGMEPFENKTANYIRSYDKHVLYRVTPVFAGNDLVAGGVLMEAYSVEDNGSGICFCVFCYNVQPGIEINYADGESRIAEPEVTEPMITEPVTEPQTEPELIQPEIYEPEEPVVRDMPSEENSMAYILNTNTKKFHYPSCSSVDRMKEKNKEYYEGSRDDVIARGFDPCKRCNP